MGSDSDLTVMEETAKILDAFEIPFDLKVISAHRTPEKLDAYCDRMIARGVQVFICGAGAAAHLAGAVAARVNVPVIGVPLENSALKGLDALLATVQMPGGVPVATMAIGKAGALNAGLLAIQILALTDEQLARRLDHYRQEQKSGIDRKNRSVQDKAKTQFHSLADDDD